MRSVKLCLLELYERGHASSQNEPGGSMLLSINPPAESADRAAVSGGACKCYFAACALTAAMSESLRSVMTPIWLVR
jgi:hypothetical protein